MPFYESDIEVYALNVLNEEGYTVINGMDITPDEDYGNAVLVAESNIAFAVARRKNFEDTILEDVLTSAVDTLNPSLSESVKRMAVKEVMDLYSPQLLDANEKFHDMLVRGVYVATHQHGHERGERVRIIDFTDPSRNVYHAINQFTIRHKNQTKRPDIILFINGLPLVVLELKNPTDEKATVRSAYDQIQTYTQSIPQLFFYNAFCIISDGLDTRSGTMTSPMSRFMAWKSIDGTREVARTQNLLETCIRGMLNTTTMLDIIQNFIVFEKDKTIDLKTGLLQIQTIKKIAAYHQYYAVNKAIAETQKAADISGNKKAGVIWHTQGSGKSLSMVFYAGKLVDVLNNPTIVLITDRNDLDEQLFDTFAACSQLLRQVPVQAESRDHVKELLSVASGGIVFTTIQKFFPEDEDEKYELLTERRNVVVIADEAHRTQYGFKAKLRDEKDSNGIVIGKRIAYGFAKYLRDAVPHATFIGFTGTPVEKTDVNTPAVFGQYIDIYDIGRAVDDGSTVKIYYESRLARVNLTDEGRHLVEEFEKEFDEENPDDVKKAKRKWSKLEAIVGHPERIKNLARDIIAHYEARSSVFDGKAMIVAMSRRIAVALYDEIIKMRPTWHSDELNAGVIKVVMTSSSSDKQIFDPEDPDAIVVPAIHRTSKMDRRVLSERMKDPDDSLKIVIVRDMWLTGFDVPCLCTMYIDKLMKGHTLMQAIARVNRVFKEKSGGLIVDYIGIGSALKEALSFYSQSGGTGDPAEMQDRALKIMEDKLEIVRQILYGFDYMEFFTAPTARKLNIILEVEEFIVAQPKGKERYLTETTALLQAFALAIPHDRAMEVKDEVALYQAIKARLMKFDGEPEGRAKPDYDTAIRQIVSQALESTDVVDIFDAAGIKKPEISLLSDEFLMEVKNMQHKNLAFELLKKIINNEIKVRERYNITEGGKLLQMLESSIKKYQNNLLTTAEIIEELIAIAKGVKHMDTAGENLHLNKDEYAFYSALETNDSAVKVLGDETLKSIAREIAEKVKRSYSIDWTLKESARAKLMVIVRRTLNKYGYPPDKQQKAIDTVLKQAALMADIIADDEYEIDVQRSRE